MLLINPQWQGEGQVISDFGFGKSRYDAEEFVETFKLTFCLRSLRLLGQVLCLSLLTSPLSGCTPFLSHLPPVPSPPPEPFVFLCFISEHTIVLLHHRLLLLLLFLLLDVLLSAFSVSTHFCPFVYYHSLSLYSLSFSEIVLPSFPLAHLCNPFINHLFD